MEKSTGRLVDEGQTIRLGLSVPMFLGSLLALFAGIFPGILGIWLFAAWKIAVPEFIKVGHAHASWWSVLILLAAFLLPSAPLKPSAKKVVIWTSFLGVPVWMLTLAAYYISKEARGVVRALPVLPGEEFSVEYLVYGTGIFVFEVWIFATLALVFLSAMGKHFSRFHRADASPSRLDILTDIDLPRHVFRIPLLFALLGLVVGWAMTLGFKARGLPIVPAALVQLHSHTFFFIVGYVLTLLAIRAVGASRPVFDLAYRLGVVGIPLIVLGWFAFNAFRLHSLVHLVPTILYFAVMILGLAALWGTYGVRETRAPHFHYVRGGLVFTWVLLIALVSVGPVIALGWNTNPNVTVTYKQPAGSPYPGTYPEKYIGTPPVARSPRGLENLHLSPGSWAHVAVTWLLALLLVGDQVGRVLGRPGLVYLAVTTIVLAPLFNAVGRIGAWLELPAGIGALWFAGHPLKFFNTFLLGAIAIAMLRQLKRAP